MVLDVSDFKESDNHSFYTLFGADFQGTNITCGRKDGSRPNHCRQRRLRVLLGLTPSAQWTRILRNFWHLTQIAIQSRTWGNFLMQIKKTSFSDSGSSSDCSFSSVGLLVGLGGGILGSFIPLGRLRGSGEGILLQATGKMMGK